MTSLIIWIGIFLISLGLLLKSADYFTGFSEKIGLALGISQFIVGVTLVSIGTSLPELASSFVAALSGNSEIVAANVLGSNIANILLVIGFAAVFAKKLEVKRNIIDLDLPLLASGAVILIALVMWDGEVNFFEGLIALVAYGAYILHLTRTQKKPAQKKSRKISWKLILGVIASGALITLSANYLIEAVVNISEIVNVSKSAISMSAIALGTTLPELFVVIAAAKRKNYEVAVGSVFGSNIFNGCVVLGLPALFTRLTVSPETIAIALPFFVASTLLFVISGITRKIHSCEGYLYLAIYILFLGKIFKLF